MSIFEYDFMVRAFIVGIMLSIVIPCVGMVVVLKRFSAIGDALSHSSLAGIAAGLVIGVNPTLVSIFSCIIAALALEAIRKKIKRYKEASIVVVLSASVGISGILLSFVKQGANFNSFLFGSIIAIDDFEMSLVAFTSLCVIASFFLLYKELFFICFNERAAKMAGVQVSFVNFIFTVLTALTVAISARTVGALVVSSLMTIPVICAISFEKSFKATLMISILLSFVFTIIGLFTSYYLNLKPGSTIVLIGTLCFVTILLFKKEN